MLMPAVQMVRESARRTLCLNKLNQIGLAVQGFHDRRRMIPPSRGADEFLTWPVYIMPELELTNLYEQFDLKRRYSDHDRELLQQPMVVLFCPSRRNSFRISVAEAQDAPVGATGDYAGNAGSSLYYNLLQDWSKFQNPTDGIFSSGLASENEVVDGILLRGGIGRYRLPDVRDGTSNTVFVGEKAVNLDHMGEPGGWGDNSIYNGDEPFAFMRLGGPLIPIEPTSRSYNGYRPSFGSAHNGVCNFVFGDGSSRPIPADTDEETLRRLCSRNDGQHIEPLN
jgi:prepilin-type processing-associated H-X9-DG protein